MRRGLLVAAVVGTLIWGTGCGGGSSSSAAATVVVTISPTTTQVVTQGNTVTFAATVNSTDPTTGVVTDITSTGVTWQVNGTTGGDPTTTGSISTSGVFTAPGVVNVPVTITVTAISVKEPSSSSSTTVVLEPQPDISISPTTATVGAGQSQTFTATVLSNVMNPVVTWQVNDAPGGNGTVGTITPQQGLNAVYKAPQVPLPGGQVVVSAVLTGSNISQQTVSATVTDTYSAASLQCSYAFLLRGENTSGRFFRAGSFTADGNGGVTGIEDINGAGGVATAMAFTGTYTVSADGRGTMAFQDNYGSNFTGSSFTFAIVTGKQLQIAEADTFATGSGEADLQSCNAPASTAFSGAYVFDFFGTGASGEPLSVIGQFNSDLSGGPTSGGADDTNDNSTLTQSASLTFSYQLGTTGGRGTATIVDTSGTKQFSFYEISASKLLFLELDSTPVVAGDAVAQTPPGPGFNTADLGGGCVMTTKGQSSSGEIATVVSFSADGLGGMQPVTLVQNNAGTVETVTTIPSGMTVVPLTGTYTVALNGRGTATLASGQTYVFYLIAQNTAVLQETDNAVVSAGSLVSGVTSAPPLSSLNGSFALQWRGSAPLVGEQNATGQFAVTSGLFSSGRLATDTANGAALSLGFTAVANVPLTPTTPYLLSTAPGTITITVGSTNLRFAVFFTSPTSAVILRTDTSDPRALSGVIAKQF